MITMSTTVIAVRQLLAIFILVEGEGNRKKTTQIFTTNQW